MFVILFTETLGVKKTKYLHEFIKNLPLFGKYLLWVFFLFYGDLFLAGKINKENMFSHSQSKTAEVSVSDIVFKATPAILILFSLTLMVFHRVNSVSVERMKLAMFDVLSPILITASAPIMYTVESVNDITNFGRLRAENIHLKNENEKLKDWYEAALRLQAENKSLRDLLNVKVDSSLSYVTARIISDAGSSFVKSVILPVGSADSVKKGSAVMSGRGLVGRITETGKHASRALLITDFNSRIPVVIQNTRTRAILAGKNQRLMKLERLPNDSGISVGARVVSSGDGGQIPGEIPIGTIVSVDESGVWVEPLSEISKLTYVQVVNTDFGQDFAAEEMLSNE